MKSLFFLLVTSVLLATIAPRVEAKTRLVAYQFDVISDGLMTFESLQQKAYRQIMKTNCGCCRKKITTMKKS
jgi:hypothetical protein